MALSSREPSSARPRGDRPQRLTREARRHWLVRELQQKLAGRCGVPPGSRVVVAVSGGPDSLALLLASVGLRERRRTAPRPAGDPVAVHVNDLKGRISSSSLSRNKGRITVGEGGQPSRLDTSTGSISFTIGG